MKPKKHTQLSVIATALAKKRDSVEVLRANLRQAELDVLQLEHNLRSETVKVLAG